MTSRLTEHERAEQGLRVTPALDAGRPGTSAIEVGGPGEGAGAEEGTCRCVHVRACYAHARAVQPLPPPPLPFQQHTLGSMGLACG